MLPLLLAANLVVSLASAVFALVGLITPSYLSDTHGFNVGEVFYARLYAARGVPFGILVDFLPIFTKSRAVVLVLLAAAFIQLLDAAIGLSRRKAPQVIAPILAALIHGACAFALKAY